jgi:hypothetical protein
MKEKKRGDLRVEGGEKGIILKKAIISRKARVGGAKEWMGDGQGETHTA